MTTAATETAPPAPDVSVNPNAAEAIEAFPAGESAAAAASGSGIVVAGYFITSQQLGALAGVSGGFSGIHAFAAANVC